MNLVTFKAEMRRIAEKNDDEWKVTVTLDDLGYLLEVQETADRHTLLRVRGKTVEQCIRCAMKDLPYALESWGYEP